MYVGNLTSWTSGRPGKSSGLRPTWIFPPVLEVRSGRPGTWSGRPGSKHQAMINSENYETSKNWKIQKLTARRWRGLAPPPQAKVEHVKYSSRRNFHWNLCKSMFSHPKSRYEMIWNDMKSELVSFHAFHGLLHFISFHFMKWNGHELAFHHECFIWIVSSEKVRLDNLSHTHTLVLLLVR